MRRGFTLIELLVTISIIAVLSAIGFATYQGIQSKARDGVRKNDLAKLATALELYLQKEGKYPLPQTGAESCSRDTTSFYSVITPYISGDVPTDPKDKNQYCYISANSGVSFRLFAKLENSTDSNISCNPPTYDYTVTSDNTTLSCPP